MVSTMEIRGARVHNLKNVDVTVPLGKIVAVAGVSGSGKSSLALGVLYAEGSRRYLEALSTYTRRRLTQATRAEVDEALHVPAALALRQRPGIPGIRSTFGTGTELLNSLRLMFSRLAEHRCPNGHAVPPTLDVAAEHPLVCPVCGVSFQPPGAEDLAFNGGGACPRCQGTGQIRTVDRATLVPDESLTIDQGAVAPWNSLMWSLMTDVCRAMGVRTDVPFRDLTPEEKAIVYDGPAEKKHILYRSKKGDDFAELDFTYFSAVRTVENALAKVKDESGMKRVERFLKVEPCPDCAGTRLSPAARAPRVAGKNLAEVCALPLTDLCAWVDAVPATLPPPMLPMAERIAEAFRGAARRLLDLGLGYLAPDRAAATLSTGERQRMQLARAVRNRSTGVLYVLDEPSIGLHPANLVGLSAILRELVADGNTVLLVDHDPTLLRQADWLIELGPGAGRDGGRLVAQGPIPQIAADPASRIGPFILGDDAVAKRPRPTPERVFDRGAIRLQTGPLHTVRPLDVTIPKGRLTAVTGVSGSGKTTLILESLVPALQAALAGRPLPAHVRALDAPGIAQAKLIDATPIGLNVRSTLATYANLHDDLRKRFAQTPEAKAAAKSPSTSSSSPTSTSLAPPATAPATPPPPIGSASTATPSPSSWPWTSRPPSARSAPLSPSANASRPSATSAWATSPSARPPPTSPAARPSASSSPRRWAAPRPTPSSSSTSRPSASTPSTSEPSLGSSRRSSTAAPPSSSSSTTSTSSATPTGSSTSAPAAASRAAASSPPAPPSRSAPTPPPSPAATSDDPRSRRKP